MGLMEVVDRNERGKRMGGRMGQKRKENKHWVERR